MKFGHQLHDITTHQFDPSWQSSLIAYEPLKKVLKRLSTLLVNKGNPAPLRGLSLSLCHGQDGCEFLARLENGEQVPDGVESFFRLASAELQRIISFYVVQYNLTVKAVAASSLHPPTLYDEKGTNHENVDQIRILADYVGKFVGIFPEESLTPDVAVAVQCASSIQKSCLKGFGLKHDREVLSDGVPGILLMTLKLQIYVLLNLLGFRKIFHTLDKFSGASTEDSGMLALRASPLYTTPQVLQLLAELRATLTRSIPGPEEFACAICQDILCNPITLPCQHSFCAWCLTQAKEHRMKGCPVCRRKCDINPKHHPVNTGLAERCRYYFPTQTKQRNKRDAQEKSKKQRQRIISKLMWYMMV